MAKFLRTDFLIEHLRWLLFKVMFDKLPELHHEERKRLLLSCSGFSINNLDYVLNWADYNDQVKPTGKDYLNVKPV